MALTVPEGVPGSPAQDAESKPLSPREQDLAPRESVAEWLARAKRAEIASLNLSRMRGLEIDPERAAKVVRLSIEERLPRELVDENLEEVEKAARLRKGPPEEWWRRHPVVAHYIRQSPYYARLTEDEILKLGTFVDELLGMPRAAWPLPEGEIERLAARAAEKAARAAANLMARTPTGAYGLPSGLPAQAVPDLERLKEDVKRREIERLRAENAFITGKDPIGMTERLFGAASPSLIERVPFFGDIPRVGRALDLYRAAIAVEEQRASDDDLEMLRRFYRLELAAKRRGTTFLSDVAEIGASLVKTVPEFGLTAGVYGATKDGIKRLILGAAEKAAAGTARRIAAGAAARAAGVAAQAVVMGAARTLAGTIERMTPKLEFGPELAQIVAQPGDDFAPALLKSFGIESVEVASERLGEIFQPLKRFVAARWILRDGKGAESAKRLSGILRTAGWHGVIPEIIEERVAGFGEKAIEGTPLLDALSQETPEFLGGDLQARQVLAEALAFLLPGAGAKALEKATSPGRPRLPSVEEHNPEILRAIGAAAKDLDLPKKSPETFEELVKAATSGTPMGYVWAPVREWDAYWTGKGVNPQDRAVELGVEKEAYVRAKATGSLFAIPTASYVTKIAPTEDNEKLAAIMRFSPSEATEEEMREFFQGEQERAREKEKAIEAKINEEEARERARLLAIEMAMEELKVLKDTDIIAQIERLGPGRIYWSDPTGQKNVEELLQSRVPEHMIADPKTARERGPTYATSIGEVADHFGMKSDELVRAIEEAWERRRELEKRVKEPKVSHNLLLLVAEEMLREDAERALSKEKSEEKPKEKPSPEISGAKISNLVRAQLEQAGYRSTEAQNQAELVEAVFRTLAVRTGQDPMALYERYGLRITRHVGKISQKELDEQSLLHEGPSEEVPKEPKGRTRVRPGKIEIDLFRKADLSTFLHELGHFFLEVLGDLATAENAPEDLKKDWESVLAFLGVENRAAIGRAEHEKFAKAFEAYLMEGQAPSSALIRIFRKFRAWLILVYKTIAGIGVELSEDIRRVFDRMIAAEEEIEEARRILGQKTFDPNTLGMSAQEALHYRRLSQEAKDLAEERLFREVAKRLAERWNDEFRRVKAEVAAELAKDPRYIAYFVIRYGRLPDGKDVPGDKTDWKLYRPAVIANFGGMPRLAGLRGLTVKSGGSHPDDVAEFLRLVFGTPYKNGEELLQAIENLEPMEAAVKRIATERTTALLGPHPGSPEMAERVQAAIHNEKAGELLLLELKHLAARSARRIAPIEVFRNWAENQIRERMKAGEFLHGAMAGWRRAMAKANKAAFEAAAKGEWDRAFIEKERELLNFQLLAVAEEAKEELDRAIDYIRGISKKSRRDAIARAGGDYLDRIDDLLERFEFTRLSRKALEKRQSFRQWVEERKNDGLPIEIPDELLEEAYRKSWLEMTVEEVLGIVDTIRHLEHLARFKNRLLAKQEQRELDELAAAARERLVLSQGGKPPRKVIEHRSPQEERRRSFAAFLAAHVRIQTYAREFDGLKSGGIWWETLIRPVNEAAARENLMTMDAVKKFQEIRDAHYSKDEWKSLQRQKRYFPGIDAALSREAAIAIALNWGNDDNRAKLKRGRGWTDAQVQEILDSLDERDWKFVQAIWDWLDSYWPEVERVSKAIHGVAPKKVQASPVVTRFGTFRGGYYPLRYEPHESERVSAIEAKQEAAEMYRAAAIISQTRHGHRTERVRGVKLPVRLDLGVLFEHLRELIHDVTHAEVLYDAVRFLRHRDVESAVKAYYGSPVYQELKDWIRDIARGPQPARNAIERALLWLRTGGIISRLGLNLKSALLQVTGLTTSVRRLGLKYTWAGLEDLLGDPARINDVVERVRDMSPMMRTRTSTQIRELTEMREKSFREGALSQLEDNWLWLTSRSQFLVDTVTWLGAYRKAIDELAEEEGTLEEKEAKARAIADQTVLDTQGSGEVKDLASVQRASPLLKLFTTFYGYFGVVFNETRIAIKEFSASERTPADYGKLAMDMLLLYSFPAAVAALITSLLGDGDDDTFVTRLIKEHAATAMNTVVLVREVSGIIESFQYRGPAGSAVIGDVANLLVQVGQGEVDESLIRATVFATGGIFHYPAVQIWRFVHGMKEVMAGEPKGLVTSIFGR